MKRASAMPGAGQRADRAGGDRVDANVVGTEVGGEIAHARLERRLGDAHHVVVRHDPRRAAEGQRQHRAARGISAAARLATSVNEKAEIDHRADEVLARRVGVAALEFVAVGKADAMDEEVEAAPRRPERANRPRRPSRGPRRRREATSVEPRLSASGSDPLAERLALIGEGEFGPFAASALAMPQAIEWSLATPMTRPRLPFIRPDVMRTHRSNCVVGKGRERRSARVTRRASHERRRA